MNNTIIEITSFTVSAKNSNGGRFVSLAEALNEYITHIKKGLKPTLRCWHKWDDGQIHPGHTLLQDGSFSLCQSPIDIVQFNADTLLKYRRIRINLQEMIQAYREGRDFTALEDETILPVINPIRPPKTCQIDLGFTTLTAEVFDENTDTGRERGIVVGMFDVFGDWQDLCLIKTDAEIKDKEAVKCFVYADADTEDYTHRHVINRYHQ